MNLNKLEQLAKAATPGPWHWECDEVKGDPYSRKRFQVTTIGKTVTRIYYSSFEGGPTNAEDDAKYIAAANPSAISELIAKVAELEEKVKLLRQALIEMEKWAGKVHDGYPETTASRVAAPYRKKASEALSATEEMK